jgi:hypothetical protein
MARANARARRGPARAWLVVVLVGVLVELVVFGLQLFPRLNAGQDVLDAARPAFTDDRVAGNSAGIGIVSKVVDTADPLVTPRGGAAGEVHRLLVFVSHRTGLSEQQVLRVLRKNFPHTAGLLESLPWTAVSRELPSLTSEVVPDADSVAPRLSQALANLPRVTRGWHRVPGTKNLTRFDGSRATSVRSVRDYFGADVIPALQSVRSEFHELDGREGVGYLAPLLAALGAVVILFGGLMVVRPPGRRGRRAGWSLVTVIGIAVLALVAGLSLFSRLDGGQRLLDRLSPAFEAQRVAGARAGIAMVSRIVDTADPLVRRSGGGAGEVPKLVAYAARRNDISRAEAASVLRRRYPHSEALLRALPLSAVTRELPRLNAFLASTANVGPSQLRRVLADHFPHLSQAITALPAVTSGWNSVPGARDLTRFDGVPATTVPAVRDYFSADLIPVLERQGDNFRKLDATFPPLTVFSPLLAVIGLVVIAYGLIMLRATRRRVRPVVAARRRRVAPAGQGAN